VAGAGVVGGIEVEIPGAGCGALLNRAPTGISQRCPGRPCAGFKAAEEFVFVDVCWREPAKLSGFASFVMGATTGVTGVEGLPEELSLQAPKNTTNAQVNRAKVNFMIVIFDQDNTQDNAFTSWKLLAPVYLAQG
jgi:hypothetical protein